MEKPASRGRAVIDSLPSRSERQLWVKQTALGSNSVAFLISHTATKHTRPITLAAGQKYNLTMEFYNQSCQCSSELIGGARQS